MVVGILSLGEEFHKNFIPVQGISFPWQEFNLIETNFNPVAEIVLIYPVI